MGHAQIDNCATMKQRRFRPFVDVGRPLQCLIESLGNTFAGTALRTPMPHRNAKAGLCVGSDLLR